MESDIETDWDDNPYFLEPNVNKLIRKNQELKEELEKMKTLVKQDSAKIGGLYEDYEQTSHSNILIKNKVDVLMEQLKRIISSALSGEITQHWDEEISTDVMTITGRSTEKTSEKLILLQETIKVLRKQISEIKTLETTFRLRLSKMEDKLDEKDKRIQDLENEKECWLYTEKQLKEKILLLQNEGSSEKLKALQVAYSESQLEMKKREELLKQQQSTEEKQKNKASQLQKEIKILSEKNKNLTKQLKSLDLRKEKASQLSAKIKEKNIRITELERENNQLRKDMSTAMEQKEKVSALSEEVKVLRKSVASTSSEMSTSQKLQEKLVQVQNQNKQLHQSLQHQIELTEGQQIQIADELQHSMLMKLKFKELQKEKSSRDKNTTDSNQKYREEFENILLIAEEKQSVIDRLKSDQAQSIKYIKTLEHMLDRLKKETIGKSSSTKTQKSLRGLEEPITETRITEEHREQEQDYRYGIFKDGYKLQKLSSSKDENEKHGTAQFRSKISEGIIKRLENERIKLNKEIENLHNQLKQQTKIYNEDVAKLEEKHEANLNELKKNLNQTSTKLKEFITELSKVTNLTFTSSNNRSITLQTIMANLKKRLMKEEEAEEVLQKNRNELQVQQNEIAKLNQSLFEERLEKQDAQASLGEIYAQYSKVLSREDETRKEFQELLNEKGDVEESLVIENNATEKENFRLRQEVEKLKQQIEDLISQQTIEIDKLKYHRVKTELETTKNDNRILTQKLEELIAQNQNLKRENILLDKKFAKNTITEAEAIKVVQDGQELENEVKKSNQNSDKRTHKELEKIEKMQQQINHLSMELRLAREKNSKSEDMYKKLKMAMSKNEPSSLFNEMANEIEKLKGKLAANRNTILQNKNKIERFDEINEQLESAQQCNESLSKESEALKIRINELIEEAASTKNKVFNVKQQNAALDQKLNLSIKETSNLQSENEQLKINVQKLTLATEKFAAHIKKPEDTFTAQRSLIIRNKDKMEGPTFKAGGDKENLLSLHKATSKTKFLNETMHPLIDEAKEEKIGSLEKENSRPSTSKSDEMRFSVSSDSKQIESTNIVLEASNIDKQKDKDDLKYHAELIEKEKSKNSF